MKIEQRKELLIREFKEVYGDKPAMFVQAPGRVDLMGSHTDYNLGYVLTQAIDRNIIMALRPRTDKLIHICSLNVDGCGEFDLENIEFNADVPWTNYIGGVAAILQEVGYWVCGFDGMIHSTVPIGSGLSSSAAMEVSTAVALNALGDLDIDPVLMAKLCQRAENEFVGMNCGILDQYSSAMGKVNSVILLDCRSISHEIKPIAPGIQVMICDTRARRELTGSEYPERRAQCEQGVRDLAGFYSGIHSLRDVSLNQLHAHKDDLDPVVFNRCKFIIEENQRVLDISKALATGNHEAVGQLALNSYEGARYLFEIVSDEMNAMKEAIMGAPGVFGTRGAGAGFGGCLVAFIADGSQDSFYKHVYAQYKNETGIVPDIFPAYASAGAGVMEK